MHKVCYCILNALVVWLQSQGGQGGVAHFCSGVTNSIPSLFQLLSPILRVPSSSRALLYRFLPKSLKSAEIRCNLHSLKKSKNIGYFDVVSCRQELLAIPGSQKVTGSSPVSSTFNPQGIMPERVFSCAECN